jgi:bifunctional DNA-binding transcriptional regulator/antitoxin component of YhaV-PrlF toxin-antitoxin module
MDNVKPYKSQIRGRGQLTIPKKMREKGTLYDGEAVSIIPIGDSILVTPRKLELDEARLQLGRIMKASGVTLEELIEGLEDERRALFEETYGEKKS